MFDKQAIQEFFLILVIILSVLLVFIVIILRINRIRIVNSTRKQDKAQRVIDDFLAAYLFDSSADLKNLSSTLVSQIPFHNKWCKELVISNLVDLEANLKGGLKDQVRALYIDLNLHEYSYSLMRSKRWYIKIKGIYHLRMMKYQDAIGDIKHYIDSENPHLRSAAVMALLILEDHEPLSMLGKVKGVFSRLDEIRILEIIKTKKLARPQDIDTWLESDNPSFVILTLRIMAYYNYSPKHSLLRKLLKSNKPKIRGQVIVLIRLQYLHTFEKRIILTFETETEDNKLEILKTLTVIGSEYSLLLFDKVIFDLTAPLEFKLAAMEGMKQVDSEFLEQKFEDADEYYQKLKLHINDPHL